MAFMDTSKAPGRITILKYKDGFFSGWTVIADGRICDGLSWDEMLGHVARITMGLPGFNDHSIGEEWRWPKIKGLLT